MRESPSAALEERRFDPPRAVFVEQDGAWWPGWQRAWRLCDDGRGWMAEVTWTEDHDWGAGNYSQWCGLNASGHGAAKRPREDSVERPQNRRD